MSKLLEGLRILVLEDEYLIAMDVEQLCRDHGAMEVAILGSLRDVRNGTELPITFDAAVIDVMLGGASTLEFAQRLKSRDVPFVFATGYSDVSEIARLFPGVKIIGKPYSGEELVEAIAAACGRVLS